MAIFVLCVCFVLGLDLLNRLISCFNGFMPSSAHPLKMTADLTRSSNSRIDSNNIFNKQNLSTASGEGKKDERIRISSLNSRKKKNI